MAPHVSAVSLRNSSSSSSAAAIKTGHHRVLKKGPWTTSEDTMLVEYVKKNGEGNWNAVQKNTGLMRCGKSCRLRWANHLRPNLKKGAFTAEEERLIVHLHAKLGNKWAQMTAQLPGRTDNEIKNYWNTRFKRRRRAGLPIYPQEHHQEHQIQQSPPPPSFSSLLPTPHHTPNNPNPSNFFDTFTSIIDPSHNPNNTHQYLNHQLKLYRGTNGSLALSLNSSSFSSPMENPLPLTPSLFQYNSIGFGNGVLELPSIQTPPSSSSHEVHVMANSSDGGHEDYNNEVEMGFSGRSNSGLLEDLLEESQALANCAEKPAHENVHEKATFEFGHGNDINSGGNNYEEGLHTGKDTKAPREGVITMDDELLNLLDSFPLSVPIPDWGEENGRESPVLTNGTKDAIENVLDALEYNSIAATSSGTTNEDWNNFGACLWNNMPSIY